MQPAPPPQGPPPPTDAPQPQPPLDYGGYRMPPYPGPMVNPGLPTDTKATLSLVLGLISLVGIFCYIGLFVGIPAIILGALARRDIRRSGGAVGGSGMALAGIITGSIGSTLFLLYIGFLVSMFVVASKSIATLPTTPLPSPPIATVVPTASPSPGPSEPVPPPGAIHVDDLRPSGGPLRTQLGALAKSAASAKKVLLVQTTQRGSAACDEIARAMPEPAMQRALAGVNLARVDVDEFRSGLGPLKMNEPSVPWFYLVDPTGRPTDSISADEWDDNDAENMAPVLRAFVRGGLRQRRAPAPSGTAM
jgi:uncharacterized protein DUF4190